MSILEILGANSCCIYFRKTALKMRLNETVPVTLFYFFFNKGGEHFWYILIIGAA